MGKVSYQSVSHASIPKTQIGSSLFFFLFFNVLNLQNFAPKLMGFFSFVCLIQKEGEKNGGGNKVAPAPAPAEKKDDVSVTAVYKINCNCNGCVEKIEKALRHFDGKIHIQTTNQLHFIFQIVYCYYLFNPTCFTKLRNLGSAFPVGHFQKNFIV